MPFLSDGHRQDLHGSGLSDETMIIAGIYSAPEPEVRALLGYGAGPGMVFPFPSLDGAGFTDYAIVKPDRPPDPKRKYLLPTKRGNRLYIPPEPLFPRRVLSDPREAIWWTEGQKKALAACQHGLRCVALSGVWNWRGRRPSDGRSGPLEDLDRIVYTGRPNIIVFDSDIRKNSAVEAAARAFGAELVRRGGRVELLVLPPGPAGAKVGLDDFLIQHSVDVLCQQPLVALAVAERRRRRLEITTADGVAPERLTWLWPNRYPAGSLVVIASDPGVGKSLFTVDSCSRFSRRLPWPDGAPACGQVVESLIFSAEDSLAHVIRPRLDAAGAAVEHVHLLRRVLDARGEVSFFSLGSDLPLLEEQIRARGIRFLVLDVLNAYLPNVDSYKDADIRRVLGPLAALAERTGCTIAALMHLSKDADRKALYRIVGSIGYVGQARVVLLLVEDPEHPGRRLVVVEKNNYGPHHTVVGAFTVEETQNGAGSLVWEAGPLPTYAEVEAMIRGVLIKPEEAGAREEARDFLREILGEGTVWSETILKAAEDNGIKRRTLFRAKKDLRVRSGRVGAPGSPDAAWYWWLPGTADRPPKVPRPSGRGHSSASKSALLPEGWHSSGNSSEEKLKESTADPKSAMSQGVVHSMETPPPKNAPSQGHLFIAGHPARRRPRRHPHPPPAGPDLFDWSREQEGSRERP
jgi:AAA domain/Domain of unknown function (DUF3854)